MDRIFKGLIAVWALLVLQQAQSAQAIAPAAMGSQYRLHSRCTTDVLYEPTTTKQVARLVAQLYAQNQADSATKVMVRVSRPYYHSTASFPCPSSSAGNSSAAPSSDSGGWQGGDQSLFEAPMTSEASATAAAAAASGGLQVGILNTKLNRVLAADREKSTLRVGAGMTTSQLINAANKYNMSVQIGIFPPYSNLTLGGMFLTGAHGSGFMTTNSLGDTVLEFTWVDGTGKVRTSRGQDPAFKAFPGSLGRLGIVTELLLQLTPPTATTVVTINSDDSNLFQKVMTLLKQSPNTFMVWALDAGLIRVFQLSQAPAGTKVEPKAQMSLLTNLKKTKAQQFVQLLGRTLDVWSATTDEDSTFLSIICPMTPFNGQIGLSWASVNGVRMLNGTGPTNAMQSCDCKDGCVWAPELWLNASWHDVDFAIELEQLEDVIADMKRVMEVELREKGKAAKRCLVNGFFSLRFGQPSDSLVGMTAGMKQPVFVQIAFYRSNKHPNKPIHYQFIADLLEELLLCKYNARPHPGKNFDRAFTHPRCTIPKRYPKLPQLLQLAQQYDPAGMFTTDLFEKMAAGRAYSLSPKCTLKQQCYCEADEHCPDGFSCIPSLAFPTYKVCKSPMIDKPASVWSQISPFSG